MTLVIPRGPTPDALVAACRSPLGWMTTSRPGGAYHRVCLINPPGGDCSRSVSPAKLLAETHALPDKKSGQCRGISEERR